jgi:hypothetical protein
MSLGHLASMSWERSVKHQVGPGKPSPQSHAPRAHPWGISAEADAVNCDLRSSYRRWGCRTQATCNPPTSRGSHMETHDSGYAADLAGCRSARSVNAS